MTLLCVPIMVEDLAAAATDARAARDGSADLVEFRVDSYYTGTDDETQIPALVRLVSECPLPCIVTCRPVLEGGQYDGDDQARIALLERLGTAQGKAAGGWGTEHPPKYLDVELGTYTRSENIKQKINLAVDHPGQLREMSTALILSVHDFQTRPNDLIRRVGQMVAEPACRVVKVAYRARSLRDNLELLDLIYEASTGTTQGKPMIALAMGPFGMMSRVLAPKFGGFLTFASLKRTTATAPGQPTIDELGGLYRFKSITESTRVYGVIGYPVEHSLSPLVHNAGFEALGHDGVYLPMPIPPEYEHFKATLLAMIDHPHLDFSGCSVTIPHKQHLVRLAREQREEGDSRWSLDALSERCGAANTLTVKRSPRGLPEHFDVANTDGPAVVELLREYRPTSVAILGTGGAARAVAVALLAEGLPVLVCSRELARSQAFVAELGDRATALTVDQLAAAAPSAVVNCTPVGMAGGPGPADSPLPQPVLQNLPRSSVVLDGVYNPLRTPLLKQAETAGLRTIGGLEMFVKQAAAQFELWTGRTAPSRLFDRISRETLESRPIAE
ncbi:MAG: type I 3-dehydroquinate dehydratase [Phycisphaerales bacterium]